MGNDSRTLWISLGAGLLSALLLYSYSQEKKAEYDRAFGTKSPVVRARVDIAEMQTIDNSMLELTERPSDYVEPGAVREIETAIGQVAAVPIKKGETLVGNKLLQPGPDTGISLQVAPRKRALALPIDEVRGVARLIRPGDRLDVYAAVDVGRGLNTRREVAMILSDVVVLATGVSVINNIPRMFELDPSGRNVQQVALSGDTRYTSITLEVSPKEAQDLIFLQTSGGGNIYFALRNPNDREIPTRFPSSTVDSILGRPPESVVGAGSLAPTGNPFGGARPNQQGR